jgi:hypothetical protein
MQTAPEFAWMPSRIAFTYARADRPLCPFRNPHTPPPPPPPWSFVLRPEDEARLS